MIKLKDCKERRIYRIHSRNLILGVFDGKDAFIGIREKFNERFLFPEYHWDTGAPYGTVKPLEDTGVNVPSHISLSCYAGRTYDWHTSKDIACGKPVWKGGIGWYFLDNSTSDKRIIVCQDSNEELFEFLAKLEKKLNIQKPTIEEYIKRHEEE